SLDFHFNEMVSCITISKVQIERIAMEDLDTEGIVNLARDIAGIEAAVFLKEKERNIIKASLRSKDMIDVCAVAKEFGGGGHTRAAGCTIHGSIENAKTQILQAIEKQITVVKK
ncbi:MAG: putative RNA-binding protein, partial [Clostridia bacterium]|nr:putative RNA-binding protein [Clostridia bacterium]